MVTEKTEQSMTQQAETGQTLEQDNELQNILTKFSTEAEGASQDEEKAEQEKTEEPAQAEETADAFTSRVQAEVDKRLNTYRDKREADTALIRSLNTQLKEVKAEKRLREGNKLVEKIVLGDEEAGISADESKTREVALKEFNNRYKEYKEKSLEIEEAAQSITTMTEKLPQNIVKEFGLDDPNPVIRAANGAKFLDDTVAVYQYTEDFLLALEHFLPKGYEVRKQVEELVQGLADFRDEKSKKLYLKDKLQGIKVMPRKKPELPSDGSGGGASKLRGDAALAAGLKEEREKLKIG